MYADAWVPAPGNGDRDALDAWCGAVGPMVLHREGAAIGVPHADSVLVATWNVHVGGGDIAGFVADLRAGRLTGGDAVEHFVLLIQEAHRAGPAVPQQLADGARSADRIGTLPPAGQRTDIVEAARALRLHMLYVPSMRNGADPDDPPEDRGNAILSTLPLTRPAAIELPYEAQRRVVAAATVDVTSTAGRSWSVRLASVHLDNRSRLTRGIASLGPGRGRQARAVAEAMADDTLAVVGGDMNSWSIGPLEMAPRILRRHFPDAAPHDGKPTHVTGVIRLRLDELFFRGSSAMMTGAERVDDRYGSDHHAVMAWVRVREP
jgi:endonuclease/exonuclease/phosphatase family metal-dependent hydrolase